MARSKLILDRYRIIDEAGSGGFATVERAWDTRLERDVAIKCIALSPSEVAQARLLAEQVQIQNNGAASDTISYEAGGVSLYASDYDIPGLEEARTAAQLNDANIVTIYDCEVHDLTAYVIMEYVEGKTLARILNELGDGITLDVIAAIFSSVAHALEVAHEKNVLHFDIKPENVIINDKGVVKVADFGLAALVDAGGQATAGGGTIGYMPPEQIRQEPLDARTDEWALASLTYEMLTGSNPFFTENINEAITLIEDTELILPSLCWQNLNKDADDVVFKALDPDPDERYDSVAAFDKALTPFLGKASDGKKVLAAVVNDEEDVPADTHHTTAEYHKPRRPLIDCIGPKGAGAIMRILAALGTAAMAIVAMTNIRLDSSAEYSASAEYGLASEYALIFWIILAVCVVLALIRPRIGQFAAFVLFAFMLFYNNALVLGIVMVLIALVWWIPFARRDDSMATITLLQPLGGAFGMAAMAPVAAGAVLSVGKAFATALFSVFFAIMFASFGSGDLMNWDILRSLQAMLDPDQTGIVGVYTSPGYVPAQEVCTQTFYAILLSPVTWCVGASWVLAAVLYALFCKRGTRAFDITGSIFAAMILLAGVLLAPGVEAFDSMLFNVSDQLANAAYLSWPPTPLALAGALVPGIIGIILAIMKVTDRVRLEKGQW